MLQGSTYNSNYTAAYVHTMQRLHQACAAAQFLLPRTGRSHYQQDLGCRARLLGCLIASSVKALRYALLLLLLLLFPPAPLAPASAGSSPATVAPPSLLWRLPGRLLLLLLLGEAAAWLGTAVVWLFAELLRLPARQPGCYFTVNAGF